MEGGIYNDRKRENSSRYILADKLKNERPLLNSKARVKAKNLLQS